MKGKIYRIRGIGLFLDYALVEDGEVYEFIGRSMMEKDGYCKVRWKTKNPPYKRIVKVWKYRRFIDRCDSAPFATWRELYSKK